MKRVLRGALNAAVLVLLATALIQAQAGSTAQLSGIVKDTSGGVLPGVSVTATQTATGVSRTVITDEQGNYTLTNLAIGPYRLEAKLSGFRSFTQTGITLQVNANPTINIELSLGDLTEIVSVEAATPLVETRNTSIGTVVDNEKVEQLPLNGRNPADLIQLAGAAVPQPQLNASSRSMQGGQAIAVAGSASFGVAYSLDGANHNNAYDNLNLPLPFPDAMQEFRLETSAQNAQNGFHSGASVNVATKSGTNQNHGDVFEFFRNHRFNATNPFNAVDPATGKRRDDGLNRNQFGGTLGGPIRTDRAFFFGAYQGTLTSDRQSDRLTFIPTPAMLAGDFTAIASAACNTRGAVTLRPPFINNQIAPALLSPAAVAIAKKLPVTSDPCGRTSFSTPRDIDEKQGIGRIDYNFNQNTSMFGRYMATTYFYAPPFGKTDGNVLSTLLGGRDNLAQSLALGETMVLSNATVNNIRFSYNRTSIHRTGQNFFGVKDVGINTFSYTPDYMLLGVTGAFSLGGGTESDAKFKTNSYSVGDDLTMIRGDHQWGFGTQLSYWNSLSQANVRSPGQFSFDGSATGLSLADFMTGRLTTFIQSAPNTLDMLQWYFGLYAQDTWKLNPRMTLNYGLRWEPWFPQQFPNGAIYNFDIKRYLAGSRSTQFPNAPAGFIYPGDDGFVNGKAGVPKNWKAVAPRVGFAWDPTGNGRHSVRAGYSLGNDFVNGQFFINTANAPPWGSEVRLTSPVGGLDNPFVGSSVPNPFPITFDKNAPFSLNGPYLVPPTDLENTKVHAWNVSYQQQLGNNDALSASYIGNFTDNLWDVVTGNPGMFLGVGPCTLQSATGPRAQTVCSTNANLDLRRELTIADPVKGQYIGFLDYFTDHGTSQYNGLLLSWQHRTSNGFSTNVNYTLSKCTGYPSQGGTTPNVASGYMIPVSLANPPGNADALLDRDKGPCDTDRRHIFNGTVTVQSPEAWGMFGRDWSLSGIYRAYSGSPFSVTTGQDRALTGNPNAQRVDQVGSDPYGAKTVDNWLNAAAFAQPALGEFGTSGRNAYYGPGQQVVDLSLVRAFRLNAHRIEARVEAFNAFNSFRRNNPVSNLTLATFGRITSAGDPRIMQFALKYSF
jgi:hypothetical protein